MGLFDKMRGALDAVTGRAAQVTLEMEPPARLGEEFRVRVTAVSSGAEVKSQGVFIDVVASERVTIKGAAIASTGGNPMGASQAGAGLPPVAIPGPAFGGTDKSGRSAAGLPSGQPAATPADVDVTHVSYQHSFQIAPPFVLAPGETRQIEGTVVLPSGVQPSYLGQHAHHEWHIRGRLEAWGNDPDSGFQSLRVIGS